MKYYLSRKNLHIIYHFLFNKISFIYMINIRQIFSEMHTQNIAIVDVRTHEEHTQISIPNTLHIPLDELENRLHELEKFEKVYFFFRAGRRSMIAEEIVKSKGLKCVGLPQGIAEIIDILA